MEAEKWELRDSNEVDGGFTAAIGRIVENAGEIKDSISGIPWADDKDDEQGLGTMEVRLDSGSEATTYFVLMASGVWVVDKVCQPTEDTGGGVLPLWKGSFLWVGVAGDNWWLICSVDGMLIKNNNKIIFKY